MVDGRHGHQIRVEVDGILILKCPIAEGAKSPITCSLVINTMTLLTHDRVDNRVNEDREGGTWRYSHLVRSDTNIVG